MCNVCGWIFIDKFIFWWYILIYDKNILWKFFFVIVDGLFKNDDGYKIEQFDEEYVLFKFLDKLLFFVENGYFYNLVVV